MAIAVPLPSASAPTTPTGMSDRIFPKIAEVEGFQLSGFTSPKHLFERIAYEIRRPRQSLLTYLNVHVANTAIRQPSLKKFLTEADCLYCDGSGIQMGASLLGESIPCRLPAADWFIDLFQFMADEGFTAFLLGGEPGVAQRMTEMVRQDVPNHTITGLHHGYILNDPEVEARVIAQINEARPDLLIVGFGTPLQEDWITAHRDQLDVSLIIPLGAVMDYFAGQLPRCPEWMGNMGLEWLFRFAVEPKRLFTRYMIGNPWFLSRMLIASFKNGSRSGRFTQGA